jgi:hypothetical protein
MPSAAVQLVTQAQPLDGGECHSNVSRQAAGSPVLCTCLLNSLYITGYVTLGVAPQDGSHPFLFLADDSLLPPPHLLSLTTCLLSRIRALC